jgi:ribA/ribD-fused uncharacterized protein
MAITHFSHEYDWLSNFYSCPVKYEGLTYMNSEAAYQAQKTLDINERKLFCTRNPSLAKLEGRQVELRKDWEIVKDKIMYEIVYAKFSQNNDLKKKLLETDNEFLVEGNWWHDNHYGDCYCEKCRLTKGENILGQILMRVRTELKGDE